MIDDAAARQDTHIGRLLYFLTFGTCAPIPTALSSASSRHSFTLTFTCDIAFRRQQISPLMLYFCSHTRAALLPGALRHAAEYRHVPAGHRRRQEDKMISI